MPAIDSTLPRRQLGRHLREGRESIGLTLVDAAKLMQWGKSTLQRLEKGQTDRIRTHDVTLLCEIYQLRAEQTADLVALAEQAAVKNWWHAYGALLSPNFDVYMGLESAARQMRSFQPCVIPGLLQIPDYARTLDRLYFPDDSEDELDRRVGVRVRRQGVINRKTQPAELEVILHESCLRTTVGSWKTMARQLRHLADLGTKPNIDIRVLPFRAGLPAGHPTGAFTILEFSCNPRGEQTEPTVVYAEAFTGAMYFEDADDVGRYRAGYGVLQSATLNERASRDLLRELAREHERER
ncbi:MAG: helix-turn-helix domain-containing protein [Nocardia sp.]|nr:helix-turn-helix domain-containing protein [Nocardia sp.]